MFRRHCLTVFALAAAMMLAPGNSSSGSTVSYGAAEVRTPAQMSMCEFKLMLKTSPLASFADPAINAAERIVEPLQLHPCCETCYTMRMEDITLCQQWRRWGWPSYSACYQDAVQSYIQCRNYCESTYHVQCDCIDC